MRIVPDSAELDAVLLSRSASGRAARLACGARWTRGATCGFTADDNRYRIRHYVETIYYLESLENPQNEYKGERFDEHIYEREIDFAARAFGKGTSDDPEQPNFQQRFEQKSEEFARSRTSTGA